MCIKVGNWNKSILWCTVKKTSKVTDSVCGENQNRYSTFSDFLKKKKLYPLWDSVGKYVGDGQATDDNIIRRVCFA